MTEGNGRILHAENRKEGDNRMGNHHQKVIGYVAFASPMDVVCPGAADDACVISDSTQAMKTFLAEIDSDGQTSHRIKKTRFGEILKGLTRGAAYAFDEESYARFFPLARKEGCRLLKPTLLRCNPKGFGFLPSNCRNDNMLGNRDECSACHEIT